MTNKASRNLILATSKIGLYQIAVDSTVVDEGDTITFTITTEEIDDGTTLYWTLVDIQAEDFDELTTSGTVVINSNTGSIVLTVTEDFLLEGTELFYLQLRVYSLTGPVVANSSVITINDTSVPTMTVTPNDTTLNEGQTVTFSVASNGYDDATYFYNIEPLSGQVNISDFTDSDLTGSFVLSSGSGSFTKTTRLDWGLEDSEGSETFRLNILDSANGSPIATTNTITIADTAFTSYTVTPSTTEISETETITITVDTTGVANATTLYYTIVGSGGFDPATEFEDGAANGSFSITGTKFDGTGSFTKTILTDSAIETGESFIVQIRTDSISGPIVATSNTIFVFDEPPTYAVTPDVTTVYEGTAYNEVVFGVVTTNIADDTILYYSIDGSGISAGDFTDNTLTGSFTITGNVGSVTKTLAIDHSGASISDDNETFRLNVRTESISGTIVATSDYVTARAGYSLTQDPDGAVYEGETVTYTLVTRAVPNGKSISYDIQQGSKAGVISGADFDDGVLTGNLTVSATGSGSSATGTQTFTKTLVSDSLSDSGEDWSLLIYDGPNKTGSIVAYSVADNGNLAVSVSSDPSYTITPDQTSVAEGDTVTFTVTTFGVADGTTLYWTTTGTTNSADFDDGLTSGSVTVNSGSATIARLIATDTDVEGSETFALQLRTGSTSGTIVATSDTVTVGDVTYAISPNTTTPDEGDTVTFTVTTTNVPNGTTLYWTTTGTVDAADFDDATTSGTVTINSGSGTIARPLAADSSTEGSETFQLQVRTGSVGGTVVATSSTVTVGDTSLDPPTYDITNDINPNEGQTVTFTVTTTNVPDGTTLYWEVEPSIAFPGIDSDDFTDGLLQGTVSVTSGSGSFTKTLTEDETTEGAEAFQMRLFSDAARTVSVAFTTVSVSDTSQAPPTYDISPNTTSVNEGGAVVFTVTTTAVPDGTTLYWTTTGTAAAADFSDAATSGSVTINSNTGSITRTTVEDVSTEGSETFALQLRTGSTSGTIVDTSATVTINDTSTGPTGSPLTFTFYGSAIQFFVAPSGNVFIEYNSETPIVVSTSGYQSKSFGSTTTHTVKVYGSGYILLGNTTTITNGLSDGGLTFTQWGDFENTQVSNMFVSNSYPNRFRYTATDAPTLAAGVTSMFGMFAYNEKMNGGSFSSWDTSNITSMGQMFIDCKLFNQNVGAFNVSNVTSMVSMFNGCTAFNQNITGWNTGKVTNMGSMFNGASSFNQGINLWGVIAGTSNVTNMASMFQDASSFNKSLANWNTSKVTNMATMFRNASAFNGNVTDWNTGNVTDMFSMFENAAAFDGYVNFWDVSKVTNMSRMFYSAISFNNVMGSWNVASLTNTAWMFANFSGSTAALSNTAAIGQWSNTSNITNMAWMFYSSVEDPTYTDNTLTNWNTSSVTDMRAMFVNRTGFNPSALAWDVGNVTNMYSMFRNTKVFTTNLATWNVAKVTDMSSMFNASTVFQAPLGAWNTANVTNMASMFSSSQFNGNIGTWNTGKVTNMANMFSGARFFNQNIGGWNTSNVTNMARMFYSTSTSTASPANYDLSSWNVAKVTNFTEMFYNNPNFNNGGSALTWTLSSSPIVMSGMFRNADAFNVNIASWNTGSVTNMAYMFQDNSAFDQNISTWNVSSVIDSYRFDYNTNVNWTAAEKPTF